MKALVAFLMALTLPILVLNIFGGVISGVWLAILGQWQPILWGILSLVGSPIVLALPISAGALIMLYPAAKLAEHE